MIPKCTSSLRSAWYTARSQWCRSLCKFAEQKECFSGIARAIPFRAEIVRCAAYFDRVSRRALRNANASASVATRPSAAADTLPLPEAHADVTAMSPCCNERRKTVGLLSRVDGYSGIIPTRSLCLSNICAWCPIFTCGKPPIMRNFGCATGSVDFYPMHSLRH